MVTTVEKMNELIAPTVEGLGFELYGLVFRTEKNHCTLIVYVDHPNGVSCDDCAKISRQIGAVLDVEDPIGGRYNLEVSSPGADRLLFRQSHYERVVGERIKVRIRQVQENRRNITGILESVTGDQITLLLENGNEIVLAFAQIEKAKLVAS